MVQTKKSELILRSSTDIRYPIFFVEQLFHSSYGSNMLVNLCKNKKILLVIDKQVYRLYGKLIETFFISYDIPFLLIQLEATEQNKTMETVIQLCKDAKRFGMQRDSIFVGIGGGITMDLVGFAAFMYRRKIFYIRIPTTLVGVVDAGVGVKVGVNFSGSKNFLGGYYAPLAVFIDESFLQTLSIQGVRCGLFEILKMAILKDKYLFDLIGRHYGDFLKKDFSKNTHTINYQSALLMMQELEGNLFEANLQRIVDFGHTFSSCIEVELNYAVPHGEAVGIDMMLSASIAFQRKLLTRGGFNQIISTCKAIGFSKKYKLPKPETLNEGLNETRKHRAGNINLVLPVSIGRSIFTNECSLEELRTAVSFLKGLQLFC